MKNIRFLFWTAFSLTCLSSLAWAQPTVTITYRLSHVVPVMGTGMLLLLGIVLSLIGVLWSRRNPNSSHGKLVANLVVVSLLTSVISAGWLVGKAQAVIATTDYLMSENPNPIVMTSFPAILENDLDVAALMTSVEVSGCLTAPEYSGSCEKGLQIFSGGTCSINTVCAPDTTPDAFTFTDVTDAVVSTLITHADITPVGYDSATAVSIAGTACQMNINAAGWTTVGANVSPTQAIGVRTTSSASQATTVNCTLTVGGVSDVFSVTTAAASLCASSPLVYTTTHSPALLIPNGPSSGSSDGPIITSTINVPATYSACTITDVNVTLNITKLRFSVDLKMGIVTHPDTSAVTIIHYTPGADSGAVDTSFPGIVFDDQAAGKLSQNADDGSWPLTTGASFKTHNAPPASGLLLSSFNGKSPSGSWRFKISDDYNDGGSLGDTGTLNSWTLTIAISP